MQDKSNEKARNGGKSRKRIWWILWVIILENWIKRRRNYIIYFSNDG